MISLAGVGRIVACENGYLYEVIWEIVITGGIVL